ncbi:MAG: ABC transporter ATP-binding protein [Candidatus Heimdallarchaeaceae archaeon]|jgi:peptide/nickel transport system ATP-binding protein
MPLLEVNDLSTHYFLKQSRVRAVDDITFSVEKGKMLGLAGESGCGKTTAALSIIRMLPPEGKIIKGEVLLDGIDMFKMDREELRRNRWKDISYIFQYAMNAFNPVMTVGEQITEVIIEKTGNKTNNTKQEAWKKVKNLFEIVGLDAGRIKDYPHEFSGGMKQRAVIAMAMACDPKVIIADEPVTALDVIVEKKIIKLLKDLQKNFDLGLIFITHDLSVIAESCEEVGIMYAGKLVEIGDVSKIFHESAHPYSKMLIRAFPSIMGEKTRISPISGLPPNLANPPPGCRFHPRCPLATAECKKEHPPFEQFSTSRHYVACYHAGEDFP